jgi:ribonuclease HII
LKKQPEFIVWWDGKVAEIGAASIIAKVFRDDIMNTYAKLYPDLWVESHKWYGTKKHREYLKGVSFVTGIHRVSYKPVKEILDNNK